MSDLKLDAPVTDYGNLTLACHEGCGNFERHHDDAQPGVQRRKTVAGGTKRRRGLDRRSEEELLSQRNRELQNRLRDREKQLSILAHELRTPVQCILGWVQLIRQGQLDQDSANHALEVIKRNAKAEVELVETILDISRSVTGKLPLQPETLDMRAELRKAIDTIAPAARAGGVAIETHLPDQALLIQVDPQRLNQILLNVLSNAAKFSRHGGAVTIDTEQVNSTVQVQIRDAGIGISAEFLPRVFQAYVQENLGPIQNNTGLGIGLALVHDLVEALGGTVTVESEGRDKGAVFTVCFPAYSASQTPRPH